MNSTVSLHKFERLVDHAKKQEQEIHALRCELAANRQYSLEEVWFWQRDGQNYPNTLVCPTVIPADQLRAILKAAGYSDETGELRAVAAEWHVEPVAMASKPIEVIRPVMVLGEKGVVVAEELTIYSYRSKPKTGGFDNSRDDGIAVLHKPTGLEGRSHKYRSEHACRNEAMALLKAKLIERLVTEKSGVNCQMPQGHPTHCGCCHE